MIDKILKIVESGKNIFLTGSAGTGKTYTLNKIFEANKNKRFAKLASTGIASQNFGNDGKTIHSYLKVPFRGVTEDYAKGLRGNPFFLNKLKRLDIIVIDEVSMVSRYLLDDVSNLLKWVLKSDKPFGGKQIILVGDFFQLPPVSKDTKSIFAFQSKAWRDAKIKTIYLKKKYRQTEGDPLVTILDSIRNSNIKGITKLIEPLKKNKLSGTVTELYATNVDVNKINTTKLNQIEEEEFTFKATEIGKEYGIEKIYKDTLCQKELTLKKGAVVLFNRNDTKGNFVNGTIGKVTYISTDSIIVEDLKGRDILVEKEEWDIKDDRDRVIATVRQYPLMLGWAITIHKSQGMTLEKVKMSLKCFVYGQGYVALSRATSAKGIELLEYNQMALKVNPAIAKIDKAIQKSSIL